MNFFIRKSFNSFNILSGRLEKHLLIIEDDPDILDVLSYLFVNEGYRVTGFNSLDSIEALIESKADCYLLDEQLPYVSGHVICIILKSNERTKDTPVVLMSAFTALENFATLCKADAFVKKPFDVDDMLGVVESMVSR